MIALALIILAAICKAVADTLDHHFDTSVFRNKPRKWFDPNVIVKSAPKIFGYPLDVWHIANSVMIISFILAVVINNSNLEWYWQLLAGGVAFNLTFNLLYNKILR